MFLGHIGSKVRSRYTCEVQANATEKNFNHESTRQQDEKQIKAPIDGCMYSSPEHPIICYSEKIEFNMSAVLCLLLPLIYSRYQEFQLVLDNA